MRASLSLTGLLYVFRKGSPLPSLPWLSQVSFAFLWVKVLLRVGARARLLCEYTEGRKPCVFAFTRTLEPPRRCTSLVDFNLIRISFWNLHLLTLTSFGLNFFTFLFSTEYPFSRDSPA